MAAAPIDRLMYSVSETSQKLSLSPARVREMCAEAGAFNPPAEKHGSKWLIPRLAIARIAHEPLPGISGPDVESRTRRRQRHRRIRELSIEFSRIHAELQAELLALVDDDE